MTDRTIELYIQDTLEDSATVESRPGGEATATLKWDTTDDGDGQFTARVVLDDGIDEDLETVKIPVSADLVAAGIREDAKALDPSDGAELWTTTDPTPNVQAGIVEMRIGPEENVVYAGADAQLIALDAASGAVNWRYDGHGSAVRGIAVPDDGSIIYTASRSGDVTAIDPTGVEQWVYNGTFSSGADLTDIVVSGDGSTVFAAADTLFGGDDGNKVAAIDTATQTAEWDRVDDGSGVNALGIAPDDSVVYAASDNGERVQALAASDGAENWRYTGFPDFSGPVEVTVAPNGSIFAGNISADVYALDATGTEQWVESINSRSVADLSISPDSATLYSASYDGNNNGKIEATDAATGTTTEWAVTYGKQANSVSVVGEYN